MTKQNDIVSVDVCPRCGAGVPPTARFCQSCGTGITRDEASIETEIIARRPRRDSYVQRLREATLGDYDIGPVLGSGGMAVVYKAWDMSLHRHVAIKVMADPKPGEDEENVQAVVQRFLREARTVAALSHPHIIPVYAVLDHEDLHYFVMRFIEGWSLDKTIDRIVADRGSVPFGMVKRVVAEVASALHYAHGKHIIHRDVKPANVMIDREQGDSIVTDFGIARVLDATRLTKVGVPGTPKYMSPEQARGDENEDITGAADQYSLGVLAYEMIAGRVPFEGTQMAVIHKHIGEPPPPVEEFRPDCPPALRDLVTRMLAKEPGDRWPSLEYVEQAVKSVPAEDEGETKTLLVEMASVGADLQNAQLPSTPRSPVVPIAANAAPGKPSDGRVAEPKASASPEAPPPSRRRRWPAVAALFVVLAGAGATGVWFAQQRGMSLGDLLALATGNTPASGQGETEGAATAGGTGDPVPLAAAADSGEATEPATDTGDPPLERPVESLGTIDSGAAAGVTPPATQPEPEPEVIDEVAAPPPEPETAVLDLRLTSWAIVTIGEGAVGRRGSRFVDTLIAGVPHDIHLERPGFQSKDTTIVLQPGGDLVLTMSISRNQE